MDKTQAFHKEVGQMAKKQMRSDIVLSGIREMQIKITKTYSHTPMRMTKKKKKMVTPPNAGKDVQKLCNSYISMEM